MGASPPGRSRTGGFGTCRRTGDGAPGSGLGPGSGRVWPGVRAPRRGPGFRFGPGSARTRCFPGARKMCILTPHGTGTDHPSSLHEAIPPSLPRRFPPAGDHLRRADGDSPDPQGGGGHHRRRLLSGGGPAGPAGGSSGHGLRHRLRPLRVAPLHPWNLPPDRGGAAGKALRPSDGPAHGLLCRKKNRRFHGPHDQRHARRPDGLRNGHRGPHRRGFHDPDHPDHPVPTVSGTHGVHHHAPSPHHGAHHFSGLLRGKKVQEGSGDLREAQRERPGEHRRHPGHRILCQGRLFCPEVRRGQRRLPAGQHGPGADLGALSPRGRLPVGPHRGPSPVRRRTGGSGGSALPPAASSPSSATWKC